MLHKLLKVSAKNLAIIEISSISIIVYGNTLVRVAILLFLAYWHLKQWHSLKISSVFTIKSSVDHALYKHCTLCMVKYKYFQYSPHIMAHWS